MSYVVGDSYGSWQGAANQAQQFQADQWWRAIQANRQSLEARRQNQWQDLQLQADRQHRAEASRLADRQFGAQQAQFLAGQQQYDKGLKYNYDALEASKLERQQKQAEYDARLADQKGDNSFGFIANEVVNDRARNIPALQALEQGKLSPEQWNSLAAMLGSRQQQRQQTFEGEAALTAEQLTQNANESLAAARAALKAAQDKKDEEGTTAASAELARQFQVLSAAQMRNPVYKQQVLPDVAGQRFVPKGVPPSDIDALWHIGAERTPPAVTPPGATSSVAAPAAPPRSVADGVRQMQEESLKQVVLDLSSGRISPARARQLKDIILNRSEAGWAAEFASRSAPIM